MQICALTVNVGFTFACFNKWWAGGVFFSVFQFARAPLLAVGGSRLVLDEGVIRSKDEQPVFYAAYNYVAYKKEKTFK